MRRESRQKIRDSLVSFPSLFWLSLFFLLPTLVVFAIALKPANPYGGIGSGWTWDNLRSLANPNYLTVAWRTLWISVLSAAVCLDQAPPTGYYQAREADHRKSF